MTQQDFHGERQRLPKILDKYLSGMQHTAQGKDFKLILMVKTETRHPVGGPFGREFSAFVIIAKL